MSNFINTFHNSKWRITFSNVPTIDRVDDLKCIEHHVKSITIPDYNILETYSNFKGEQIRHPISRVNDSLSQIQLDIVVSENMENYLYLLEWMERLRYAQEIDEEKIKDENIKRITLHMLDNESRSIAQLHFTYCFLLNLSSISLNSGTDDEVVMTCNFSYEEVKFERQSIYTC